MKVFGSNHTGMVRKQWLNVTIMITINFLTPAGDLKSNDVDFTDGPDLPVLGDEEAEQLQQHHIPLPAGQESTSQLLVSPAHSGSSDTVQPGWC